MKRKISILSAFIAFACALMLQTLSCKMELLGHSDEVDAAAPYFTLQPKADAVRLNAAFSLKAQAEVTDSGTITYRWYLTDKSGNKKEEALSTQEGSVSVCNVDTSKVGTFYYFVEARNTNTSREVTRNTEALIVSERVQIEVSDKNIIRYFANRDDSLGEGYLPAMQIKERGQKIQIASNTGNLTRKGYRFSGWNTQADGNGSAYAEGSEYGNEADLNLYAHWLPNVYKLTLMLDDALQEVYNVIYDAPLPNTVPPSAKAGASFGGYYAQKQAKGRKYFTAEGKGVGIWDELSNRSCYAAWGFRIKYENVMDARNENPEVYDGATDLELQALSLPGWSFDGWFAAADYSGSPVKKITAGQTGEKTFYAKWTETKYAIKYELDGGVNASENPSAFTIKDEFQLKAPTKDGYDFGGWYTENSFSGNKIEKIEKGTKENLTLYAKWRLKGAWAIAYVLSSDETASKALNSPKNPSGYTAAMGDVPLFDPQARKGYEFEGWYYDSSFSGERITKIASGKSGDLTLYAKWKALTYKIAYNLNGLTNDRNNPTEYTIESDFEFQITKEMEARDFAGFWDNENFTGAPVRKIKKGRTGDLSLYAKFQARSYKITYYLNGGSCALPLPSTYTSRSETFTLPEPNKPDCSFGGWYLYENFAGERITKIGDPAQGGYRGGDINLYARWLFNKYRIIYELNGGTQAAGNPAEYSADSDITFAAPSRAGCTFAGWYLDNGQKIERLPKGSKGTLKLIAKWNFLTFGVTYDAMGGKLPNGAANPEPFTVNDEIVLKTPEKRGYRFEGWYADRSFTGSKIEKVSRGTAQNLTLYAKWGLASFRLTYDPLGGKMPDGVPLVQSFTMNDEIVLKTPTKAGYDFEGWYSENSFSGKRIEKIAKGSSGDKTVFAKWRLTGSWPITYVLSSGETRSPALNSPNNPSGYTAAMGDVPLLNPQARPGYEFEGWYYDKSFSGERITKIASGKTGALTVYAKWRLLSYRISYELGGGATVSPPVNSSKNPNGYTIEMGDVALFAPEARKGYEFEGWYLNKSFSGEPIPQIESGKSGDITLYAKWKAVKYKIIYEWGGAADNHTLPTEYTIESGFEIRPDRALEALGLIGFWDNKTLIGTPVTHYPKGRTGDVTLYAKVKAYALTYQFNGGTCAETLPSSYTSWQPAVTLPKPQKGGYGFNGWYASANFSGNAIAKIGNPKQGGYRGGDLTLYAQWLPITYKIQYDLDGGTQASGNPAEYNIESEVTFVAPSRNGYAFAGWYAADGTEVTRIKKGSQGALKLTAKWGLLTYRITYDALGGELPSGPANPEWFTVKDEVTLKVPEKVGYDFEGWYAEKTFSGSKIDKITRGTAQDVKLFAKWRLKGAWPITYVLSTGATVSPPLNSPHNPSGYTIETGAITLHDPLARKGYVFEGWYDNKSFTGERLTKLMGKTGALTLYAKWNALKYRITYELDGGWGRNPSEYTIETEFEFEVNKAIKPGQDFLGLWENPSFTGEPLFRFVKGQTGDKKFYAQYGTRHYTLTYHINGGTPDKPLPESFTRWSDVITLPSAKKIGYTFGGWYLYSDFSGKVTKIGDPAKDPEAYGTRKDLDLYAKWIPIKYPIQYDLGGGKQAPENPAEYTVESEVTLAPPVYNGCIFAGWFDESGNRAERITQGSIGTKKFTAKWTEITYALTYNLNGGALKPSESIPATYTVKRTIYLPSPTKAGAVFAGWYDSNGYALRKLEKAYGNKHLSAKWIAGLKTVEGGTFQRKDEAGIMRIVGVSRFHISDHEVTQKEFREILGINPSYFKGNDNLPVEQVNWYHAIAYCNKLSIKEGLEPVYDIAGLNWKELKYANIPTAEDPRWEFIEMDLRKCGYRLPTEAEWEFAASGGKKEKPDSPRLLYSGSNRIDDVAWFVTNSGDKTHPVKQKKANELGLYDMSGNVLEWCWDRYAGNNYSQAGDGIDPLGPPSGLRSWRVVRGGSYANKDNKALVNYSGCVTLFQSHENVGFRVVCSQFEEQ